MPHSIERRASAACVERGEQICTASTWPACSRFAASAAVDGTPNACASVPARSVLGSATPTISAPRRAAVRPVQWPIRPAPMIATRKSGRCRPPDFIRNVYRFYAGRRSYPSGRLRRDRLGQRETLFLMIFRFGIHEHMIDILTQQLVRQDEAHLDRMIRIIVAERAGASARVQTDIVLQIPLN